MDRFGAYFPGRDPFRIFRGMERLVANAAFDVAVSEKEGEIRLEARLPGVRREEIRVVPSPGKVAIRIERREESEVKDDLGKFFRRDSKYGRMERIVALPSPVVPESARIAFQDGILSIVLKKRK